MIRSSKSAIEMLTSSSLEPTAAGYPKSVLEAYRGAGPALNLMGNRDLLLSQAIGFCGSRKASEKGIDAAIDCADQAARHGLTVVSGNAAGVDTAAHRAALAAGGSTIIVLPEGMDHFRVRRDLRKDWDWDRVLVISQFKPSEIWRGYRAMERNKVIIALSRAMVVVEAGEKGGTMNAGLETLKTGKPLFVINFEAVSEASVGNVELLNKGAHRLSRSRRTGRANLDNILLAMMNLDSGPPQHQMNFG